MLTELNKILESKISEGRDQATNLDVAINNKLDPFIKWLSKTQSKMENNTASKSVKKAINDLNDIKKVLAKASSMEAE